MSQIVGEMVQEVLNENPSWRETKVIRKNKLDGAIDILEATDYSTLSEEDYLYLNYEANGRVSFQDYKGIKLGKKTLDMEVFKRCIISLRTIKEFGGKKSALEAIMVDLLI